MNQVDYKKMYDEALERMKSWVRGEHPECFSEARKAAEFIFPELKEGEDETVRKSLISFLKSPFVNENITDEKVSPWIAWLEKQGGIGKTNEKLRQYREYLIKETERWHKMKEDENLSNVGRQDCTGHANAYIAARREFEDLFDYDSWTKKQLEKQREHKPADEAEPKFKVGDWVVYDTEEWREVLMVDRVDDGIYHLVNVNGETCNALFEEECNMRLWGIRDAKDGDVLVLDDIIMIFKNIKTVCTANTYILYCNGDGIVVDDWCDFGSDAQPATKEQRDLLFYKMSEAGYEWDSEKKELKKIEKKYKFNIGDIISNGQVVYRVENITKNCIGQDCYFLVNVESEKMGMRYLLMSDSRGNNYHFGETTWLCEQVDKLFEKQGEKLNDKN